MPRLTRWCGGMSVMSLPSKTIMPAVGSTRPQTRLTKVVLPAPLGPMMARISPGMTAKSTPSTAFSPP